MIIQGLWKIQTWDDSIINRHRDIAKEIDDLNGGKTNHDMHNVITTAGILKLCENILPTRTNVTKVPITHHAIGTGTRAATTADISLQQQVTEQAVASASAYAGTARLATAFRHDGTDHDITEAGLFCRYGESGNADFVNVMFSHIVTNTPAELRSGKAVTVSTLVRISSI